MNEFDYVLNIENLICKKLESRNSVLLKNNKPIFYYDFKTHKIIKGLNQIKLAEENFINDPIKLSDSIYYKKEINKKIILLSEYQNQKKLYAYITESEYKHIVNETNRKQFVYSLNNIKDIILYYFTCCKYQIPYNPNLSDYEINKIINLLKTKPYCFSKIVKQSFEIITGVK